MANVLTAGLDLEALKRLYMLSVRIPAKTWVPNRAQFDFIKSVGTTVPDKRIFLMTSGNGAGKTTVAANLLFNVIWPGMNFFDTVHDPDTGETFNGFFDFPFFNNFPKKWPKKIWYVSNQESIGSIWEEFQKWIPEQLYTATANQKSYTSYVRFHNSPDKWRMWFKTVDQDPKTFESANIGIIVFDEPPPYSIYSAAISRLRAGGIIIIPATPLFGSAYFVDEIVNPAKNDPDCEKVHQTVPVWANCVEKAGDWVLGKKGIFGRHKKGALLERDILFTLNNFSSEQRKAREFGTFQHLVGVVYKTYGVDHFREVETHVHDPENYDFKFILDPHERKPPAACWARIDRHGKHTVIREWPSPVHDEIFDKLPFEKIQSADPYTIEDFVKMYIKIFKEFRIRPDQVTAIIDPNFGNKPNRETGKRVFEDYQAKFYENDYPLNFITNVSDQIAAGHNIVKEYLNKRPNDDYLLEISSDCINIDWGMRTYSFDEWEGKSIDKHGIKETVKQKGKDFPDLLRYMLMVEVVWKKREKPKEPDHEDIYNKHGKLDRPEGARSI